MVPSGMTARPGPLEDLDWDAPRARGFADRAADLWAEWLAKLPELPVSPGMTPAEVRAAAVRDVPEDPLSDDDLFDYLRHLVFDWSMYPGHPRFMAYVSGAGTVPGAAVDLLAAGLNQNLGGFQLSPAGTEIELHLVRWFAR